MSLSVDNIIGVQPTTTSSTTLQAQQIDIYNGTVNFHRFASNATTPLITITIPNASGTMTLNTATQTLTNKMNHAQNGSISDPSYSFINETSLGMYRNGAGDLRFTVGGVDRLFVNVAGIRSNSVRIDNNTVGAPGYTFFGETNSGLYRNSTNDIRMSIQGNDSVGFQTNGIRLYGSTSGNNALYSASKLGYYEEFTQNLTFTCGNQSVAKDVKFVRYGNAVNCQIVGDIIIPNPSTAQQYVSSNAFQTRFRPSGNIYFTWFVFDNATASYTTWRGDITTTGIIQLFRAAGAVAFGYTLYSPVMSWTIY